MRKRWNNPIRQRLWMQVFLWLVLLIMVGLAAWVARLRLTESSLPLTNSMLVPGGDVPGLRVQLPTGWDVSATSSPIGRILSSSVGEVPRSITVEWAHFPSQVDPVQFLAGQLPEIYRQRMTRDSQRGDFSSLTINGLPAAMVTGVRKVPELALYADMLCYEVYLCICYPDGNVVIVHLLSGVNPQQPTDLVGLATAKAVAESIEIQPAPRRTPTASRPTGGSPR